MIKRALRAICGLFHAIFEPDTIDEKDKDKEIQWERDQWGYPKQ